MANLQLLSVFLVITTLHAAVIRTYPRYDVVDTSAGRYGQSDNGERLLLDLSQDGWLPGRNRNHHRNHHGPHFKQDFGNRLRNHLAGTRGRYQHTIGHSMDDFGGAL